MPDIVTDQEVLKKKSESANDLEIGDIVQQLSVSIPAHALGLSAPQIGIHKRIFLANLSSGSYAFINPQITWTLSGLVPSEESCLSLPGIRRCVERHFEVVISCYKIIDMADGELTVDPEPMRLKGLDSFIVQHENDHLNGVLIVNLPVTLTAEERRQRKEQERRERVQSRRKKTPSLPTPKSAKNLAKTANKVKKQQRTLRRQEKIRVKIQEKYNAEKEGLFSDDTPITSDAVNEPKQD